MTERGTEAEREREAEMRETDRQGQTRDRERHPNQALFCCVTGETPTDIAEV